MQNPDVSIESVDMNADQSSQSLPTSEAPTMQLHSFSNSENPDMSPKGTMPGSNKLFMILAVVVILGGAATGIGIGKLRAASSSSMAGNVYQGKAIQAVAGTTIKTGDVFGSANTTDFKDSAQGFMVAGGIGGEGSDHLLRAGGANQTVYLTSSVTDLSKFEGMEVKVWGETFQGQKAGWLMDVGRVQVINTQGTAPTEN